MQSEDDLDHSVGELLSAARQNLGPHPEPEALMAYHEGELAPAEEERIQEHLVACDECSTRLLDLVALGDRSQGPASPAEKAAMSATWRVVQGRLGQDQEGSGAAVRRTLPPWALPLAASLMLAVGGLSLWVTSLRQTVEDLSRPQLNAPVLDLQPAVRSEEPGASHVAEVPARTRFFTLVLNPVATPGEGIFEAEILDAAGKRVWSGRGLEPNAFGSFSLTLPVRRLGPGEFRLLLFSTATGRREPIGDYDFRIRAP
jgi:putative zinc finger protein